MPLNITSLIDMFTILLIFLLVNFSSEDTVSLAPDLSLPRSTEANGEKRTSVPVAITRGALIVDGKAVATLADVNAQESLVIPELVAALDQQRRRAVRVARLIDRAGPTAQDADASWKGRVTLQGDAELPFEVLERVIYSCGQASFGEVSLAVSKVSRADD